MTTKVSGAMQSGDAGASPLTTKGDLYGHNGTAAGAIPVGPPGTFLKSDPTQPFGVGYGTPPSRVVGEFMVLGGFGTPSGWLLCDGSAVSRSTYGALLAALSVARGGNVTNGSPVVTGIPATSDLFAGCPVESADFPAGTRIFSVDSGSQVTLTGNSTVTGATVLTFAPYGLGNGSSTFNVPDWRGRAPIGAGAGSLTIPVSAANTSTDEITVQANDSLQTGQAVVYTSSGTPIGGLLSGTTYYVIRISSTTIKLSASRLTAVVGTWINLTSAGTGTQALTVTLTNRIAGTVGGEERHALTLAEIPGHTHSQGLDIGGATGGGSDPSPESGTTGSAGGSGDHNVMQPWQAGRFFVYAGV